MRFTRLVSVGLVVLAAAGCSPPEHTNPFDPRTPQAAQATATLTGTVSLELTGTSAPAPSGIAVSVVGPAGSHSAFTNDTGTWSVSGVRPGAYAVRATKDLYEDGVQAGVAVTLDDGDATVQVPAIALRARRGNVKGRVALMLPDGSDETAAGTLVSVDGVLGAVQSDGAGNFVVPGVPAGPRSLRATRPGYSDEAVAVSVEPDVEVSVGVVSVYTNPGWLHGVVTLSRVASAANVVVRARGTTLAGTPWEQTFVTPASGEFLLSGLPAGSYWVSYEEPDHEVVGEAASVIAGEITELPDVFLPVSRARIAGTVSLDVSTVPGFAAMSDLSGTVVALLDGAEQVTATVTGAGGTYAFPDVPAIAAAGAYTIRAQRPNFTSQARSATPSAGATLQGQDLTIQLRAGNLQGGVVLWDNAHGNGANASGAGVVISIDGTAFNGVRFTPASPTSGASGAWSSPPLPPGSYDVVATSSGRTCAAYTVAVVQPGPDPSLAGTVRCTDAVAPGAVGLGAPAAPAGGISGYTRTTSVSLPIASQAIDGTSPSNLRGYQWSVGAAPSWGAATLVSADPTPPASLTVSGLAVGTTNTVWVRAIDWVDNAGDAVAMQVMQDQSAPPVPVVSTPRTSVNETNASVTLTGSESDASFLRYEACWANVAATSTCTATPSCSPTTVAQTFPLPLATDQRTCVWARAVDRAGNASGYGTASVLSDLTRPGPPVIAPFFDAAALTIRGDSVDFTIVTAPTDGPAGGGLSWKGVAWLEVDSGAGFDPLCPASACHPNDTYAPCSASCGCSDPRLVCDPDTRSFRGVRVPVRAGMTNDFAFRAVDVAGNVGSAVSQNVVAEGDRDLAAATASDETRPRLRGSTFTWYQWGSGQQVLDLGGDVRRDSGDGTPCALGASASMGEPAAQNLLAFVDASALKLRRRTPGVSWCATGDTTLRTVPGGQAFNGVSATGEVVAWSENASGSAIGDRIYVREPGPDGKLGTADVEPITLVTTVNAAYVGSFQVAGRYLVVCTNDVNPACQVAVGSASGFAGGIGYVALPSTETAALSEDGKALVRGHQQGATVTLTVVQAGPDGVLFTGDDLLAVRTYPYSVTNWWDRTDWRVQIDGPHVVATDGDFSKTGYVTDWFAGSDGVFESEDVLTADDTLVRTLPSATPRAAASLSGGVVLLQNGLSGSDVLRADLTQVRWLAAAGTPYRGPVLNGSGDVVFTEPNVFGSGAYFARYRDGTTSVGTLPSAGAFQWFSAHGSYLVSCDRTSVQVQPANAGRWFVSGMAAPTTVFSTTAYQIEEFNAGGGKVIVSDVSSGYHQPIVIQSASGTLTAATGTNVLAGTGIVAANASGQGAPVAVSERYAFFGCARAAAPANQVLCVRDAGSDKVFNSGGDASTTVVLKHAPDAAIGAGTDAYAMTAKASGRRVAFRYYSGLFVIDAGPDGLFNTADDTERQLNLGYADDGSYAIGGDWFVYLDNGAPAGLQVFLVNLVTGGVRQLTSHYSTKGDLAVDATGRAVWRDDVFSSSAIFERTP